LKLPKLSLKRTFALTIIAIAIYIPLVVSFFTYVDNNTPVIEKDEETTGVYIDAYISLPFSVADLISSPENFNLSGENTADTFITNKPTDSSSVMIFQQLMFPFTNIGSSRTNVLSEEIGETEYRVENLLSDYYPKLELGNPVEYLECEALKSWVRESKNRVGVGGINCLDYTTKVLAVDGVSLLGKINDDYSLDTSEDYLDDYLFRYELWVTGVTSEMKLNAISDYVEMDDRIESSRVGTVAMTGVTAMGRTVKFQMDAFGTGFPVEAIKEITSSVDLAHTSNEVSFLEGCTQIPHTLSFCANSNAIEALTTAGIDVVELTGNHNNDKGTNSANFSLDIYDEAEIDYIGGGRNYEDADQVKYFDVDGTMIGFFGFNYAGPNYALAGEDSPGALWYTEEKLEELALEATENSDIQVMVVQWANENDSFPVSAQTTSARKAVDLGIDLIVGSQGHGTQKMEYYENGQIFYALGNFLFDQMFSDKVRQGAILRFATYEGRIVSTELIPYLIYEYAQPRPVFGTEADIVISTITE